MNGDGRRRERARSFLLGGLVGMSAAVAVRRRRRAAAGRRRRGLAAFESAPCFREHQEGRDRLDA